MSKVGQMAIRLGGMLPLVLLIVVDGGCLCFGCLCFGCLLLVFFGCFSFESSGCLMAAGLL